EVLGSCKAWTRGPAASAQTLVASPLSIRAASATRPRARASTWARDTTWGGMGSFKAWTSAPATRAASPLSIRAASAGGPGGGGGPRQVDHPVGGGLGVL